jgi:hypothetical protein
MFSIGRDVVNVPKQVAHDTHEPPRRHWGQVIVRWNWRHGQRGELDRYAPGGVNEGIFAIAIIAGSLYYLRQRVRAHPTALRDRRRPCRLPATSRGESLSGQAVLVHRVLVPPGTSAATTTLSTAKGPSQACRTTTSHADRSALRTSCMPWHARSQKVSARTPSRSYRRRTPERPSCNWRKPARWRQR